MEETSDSSGREALNTAERSGATPVYYEEIAEFRSTTHCKHENSDDPKSIQLTQCSAYGVTVARST